LHLLLDRPLPVQSTNIRPDQLANERLSEQPERFGMYIASSQNPVRHRQRSRHEGKGSDWQNGFSQNKTGIRTRTAVNVDERVIDEVYAII
jgi:hypothetical protein